MKRTKKGARTARVMMYAPAVTGDSCAPRSPTDAPPSDVRSFIAMEWSHSMIPRSAYRPRSYMVNVRAVAIPALLVVLVAPAWVGDATMIAYGKSEGLGLPRRGIGRRVGLDVGECRSGLLP